MNNPEEYKHEERKPSEDEGLTRKLFYAEVGIKLFFLAGLLNMAIDAYRSRQYGKELFDSRTSQERVEELRGIFREGTGIHEVIIPFYGLFHNKYNKQ